MKSGKYLLLSMMMVVGLMLSACVGYVAPPPYGVYGAPGPGYGAPVYYGSGYYGGDSHNGGWRR